MTQIMFETFNIPSFYVGIQTSLSLYSSGRTTGIVFDAGDSLSQIVPVYEGCSLPHAALRTPAGCELTQWLQRLLLEGGYTFGTAEALRIIREMKERVAYVAFDFEAELRMAYTTNECRCYYEVSDDNTIILNSERFRCPELLFHSSLNGLTFDAIDQILLDSIRKCDVECRKDLYANIVLSGGTTRLPGLRERLQKEIVRQAPATMKVNVITPTHCNCAAWIGGSILASQSTFPHMVISHEEYNELGSGVIDRRCF
jgi:actin